MAKRKRKTTAPRRRRMNGVGSTSMSSIIYVVGGAVTALVIGKFLPDSMDAKIKAAIPLVAGYLAPKFIRGGNGVALGAGMLAIGSANLVQTFGVLNGMGETPMIAMYNRSRRQLSGMPNENSTPQVAGISGLECNPTLLAMLEEG